MLSGSREALRCEESAPRLAFVAAAVRVTTQMRGYRLPELGEIMRVITGTAKGRRLITVEGTELVRPTTDRVKEAIFSAIQFEIQGAVVLDLFAGSGQLGIEALSRGAAECHFVDNAAPSVKAVRQNIEHCGFTEQAQVHSTPFSAFLKSARQKFDIALLDPPYERKLIQKALPLLIPKMSERGVIVCEHERECTLPADADGFELVKLLRHGGISLSIYRRPNPEEQPRKEEGIL